MNTNPHKITDNIYISGFPTLSLLKEWIESLHLAIIINNRPDHEEANQLTSDEMEKLCQDLGVEYHHKPISSSVSITENDKDLLMNAISQIPADKNILMFCRSGRRSEIFYKEASRIK